MSLYDTLYNNSYIGNYNNNISARNASSDSKEWARFNNQAMSSALGGGLAALNGVTDILGTSMQLASTKDTSMYDNSLAQMGQFRDGNTWDINQLMAQRESSDLYKYNIDPKELGPTDGQIATGVLSSTASGAMTGLQIGGPWGALIGGVIGLGAGAIGGYSGRQKSKRLASAYNYANQYQDKQNDLYFAKQADNINDFNYGNMWATRRADGGQIERKSQTLLEFSNSVLRNKPSSSGQSSGIIRKHCKGGTMIRIKR